MSGLRISAKEIYCVIEVLENFKIFFLILSRNWRSQIKVRIVNLNKKCENVVEFVLFFGKGLRLSTLGCCGTSYIVDSVSN